METAINLLEQELKWSEDHGDECPHGEKYCGGYIEGIRHSIAVLQMAKQAGGKQ